MHSVFELQAARRSPRHRGRTGRAEPVCSRASFWIDRVEACSVVRAHVRRRQHARQAAPPIPRSFSRAIIASRFFPAVPAGCRAARHWRQAPGSRRSCRRVPTSRCAQPAGRCVAGNAGIGDRDIEPLRLQCSLQAGRKAVRPAATGSLPCRLSPKPTRLIVLALAGRPEASSERNNDGDVKAGTFKSHASAFPKLRQQAALPVSAFI